MEGAVSSSLTLPKMPASLAKRKRWRQRWKRRRRRRKGVREAEAGHEGYSVVVGSVMLCGGGG